MMWRIGSWVRGIHNNWVEAISRQWLRAGLLFIVRVQHQFSRGCCHLEETRALYICRNFLLARTVPDSYAHDSGVSGYVATATKSIAGGPSFRISDPDPDPEFRLPHSPQGLGASRLRRPPPKRRIIVIHSEIPVSCK